MDQVKDIIRTKRESLGLTMKEVAKKVGVSEGTISRWESGDIQNMRRDKIVALAKALELSPAVIMGWEDFEPAQIVPHPFGSHRIPVYSAAGAGKPHLATDDVLYYTDYAGDPDGVLGVVIDGTSMTPTIPDGSVVIADHNATVDSGDIVIVVVNSDQEALCKRIRMYDDGIALLSDNPEFPPRYFSAKEVQDLPVRVIGKCTEVRKKL